MFYAFGIGFGYVGGDSEGEEEGEDEFVTGLGFKSEGLALRGEEDAPVGLARD